MFEKDYRWTLQRRYGLQISITSIQRSFAISTLAGRDWLLETMALILSLSLHALTLDRPVKHQWDCLDTVLCYYQEMCTNNTCYTFGMVSNLASPSIITSQPLHHNKQTSIRTENHAIPSTYLHDTLHFNMQAKQQSNICFLHLHKI